MSKATEAELGTLHGVLAKTLTSIIEEGVPVVVRSEEGDKVEKVPASAAYFTAAIALLKNNDITASASDNDAVRKLREALEERRRRVPKAVNPVLDLGLDPDAVVQ